MCRRSGRRRASARPALRARLLGDLAQGGLRRPLARRDLPLRKRPHPRLLARRADRRQPPAPLQPPHQHAAGREFALHARFVTRGRAKTCHHDPFGALKCPGTPHLGVPDLSQSQPAGGAIHGTSAAGRPPDRRGARGGGDHDERDRPARHREGEAAAWTRPRRRPGIPQRQGRAHPDGRRRGRRDHLLQVRRHRDQARHVRRALHQHLVGAELDLRAAVLGEDDLVAPATSSGTSSPLSLRLPGPTASTRPRCGFSFAVSGRTIPLAVVSSSSRASTMRRSPSGCRFIQPLLLSCDFVTLSGTLTVECQGSLPPPKGVVW